MSAKELLYGVVATVVPNCTGVDGGTYTGYIVQKSHFGGTVLGHSIKDVAFVPGDVVRIVQCGECLTYGGTDVPLHGWGFLPYANDYPTVLQVPEYSLVRDIETNPRHAATASLNWLCRKAGCIDKLYWPARITGISGSLVTVCDQFSDGAYQMPISSDLSIGDFSIGDYVLVYSPSSGEEVIGWWMMEPGGASFTINITPSHLVAGDPTAFTMSISNTGTRTLTSVSALFSYLAGSLYDVSASGWTPGTILPGEIKTFELTAIAAGSISAPSGWVKMDVTASGSLSETITEYFSITQAKVVMYAGMGGDTVGLYCSPPARYALEMWVLLIPHPDGQLYMHITKTIPERYKEYEYEVTPIGFGSYNKIYSMTVTGSVVNYVATSIIGSDGGPTYTVTYNINLANGDISLNASVS